MSSDRSYNQQYECLRCETVQTEPRILKSKATTIHCRGCGAPVYPVEESEPTRPAAKTRTCRTCGAKLRASNSKGQCSSCFGLR